MNNLFRFGVVIVALILVGVIAYQLTTLNDEQLVTEPVSESDTSTPVEDPTFTWKYSPVGTAEIPKTAISLVAQYPSGDLIEKKIDTVEGECNAYDKRDADVYANSEMIICYYAGLGHYYKVVVGEDGYMVQRKEFEEASPDYAPPATTYETIATF